MYDSDDLHEGYAYVLTATDTFFHCQPYVHELDSYDLDTFWVVSGITMSTSATVRGLDLNHVEGGDTVNVPVTLAP